MEGGSPGLKESPSTLVADAAVGVGVAADAGVEEGVS